MASVKKPRVLILSHMYPTAGNSISGIFIHQHVKSLFDLGIDLQVVSPAPWSPKPLWFRKKWKYYGLIPKRENVEEIIVNRPRYLELPGKLFRPYSGVSMYRCIASSMKRLYGEFPFNIIHSHTITPDGQAAVFLQHHFRAPMICTVRGSDLKQYPHHSEGMYRASKNVIEKAAAIITVSGDLAADAMAMAAIRSGPYVIYNGVDTIKFHKFNDKQEIKSNLGIPENLIVISFVGRCEVEKGIMELIEVFVRVYKAGSKVGLLIVGEGKDEAQVRAMIDKHQIGRRAFLIGKVPHDKIPMYLNASDIFILPTYSEGMANAVYEAMACGLPVITTNVGGMPEVIAHGIEGFLCQPRDTNDLEAYVVRLLKTPALSEEMGRRGMMKVRERFSWKRNALEHLDIYDKVLQDNEGRRIY